MKKLGFTLAEVIISLAIIGIVAAVTMPAISSNYQRKTYETQAKKFYNTMANAIQLYMAQEGYDDLRDSPITAKKDDTTKTSNKDELTHFVKDYLKLSQNCGYETNFKAGDNGLACFADKYYTLNRTSSFSWAAEKCATGIIVTLADGAAVCIAKAGTVSADQALRILVDTNGVNGPNIVGRDLFTADVSADGRVYDYDWEHNYVEGNSVAANWFSDKGSVKLSSYTNKHVGFGKMQSQGWQMIYEDKDK